MILTGRTFLAEELKEMGFFNKVLPRDTFEGHVRDYARMMAALSPIAVTTAKRQLYEDLLRGNPASSVEDSKGHIGRLMKHPDYSEGVSAFMEKREPRFSAYVPPKRPQ